MTKITLHTRLNAGINASDGGGQDIVHKAWNVTPRNLLLAVRELEKHSEHMNECYGKIGAGGSWLQFGDTPIRNEWLISDTFSAKQWLQRFPTPEALAQENNAQNARYEAETAKHFASLDFSQQS